MSNVKNIYESLSKNAIDNYGRNISVIYGSSANCSSCAYDPINKEGTNPACDTCNGRFFFQTENTKEAKGVLKTFVGDMNSYDDLLKKFGYTPDHDARLTAWLPDYLVDTDSSTGRSYLDTDLVIRIETDGHKYGVISTVRTGVDLHKIIVATLKEIK